MFNINNNTVSKINSFIQDKEDIEIIEVKEKYLLVSYNDRDVISFVTDNLNNKELRQFSDLIIKVKVKRNGEYTSWQI